MYDNNIIRMSMKENKYLNVFLRSLSIAQILSYFITNNIEVDKNPILSSDFDFFKTVNFHLAG